MNDLGSDITMLALVVGFLSPPILSLILQTKWSSQAKATVAFVWALVVGVVTAWISGSLTGAGLVTTILIILVTTISFYKGFWKPVGISPAIEQATNVKTKAAVEQVGPVDTNIAIAQAGTVDTDSDVW